MPHPVPRTPSPSLSRPRLLLLLLAGIAAVLGLAACGTVDDSTVINADGSGVQTLQVTVTEQDMESIEGGVETVEAVIAEHNPGLEYVGVEKNGTDTVFTMTLAFSSAEDYAAKAQPVLEAGELTKTAEVTFTPPTPPFSSGYTVTRNFTALELTRWATKALVEQGSITDADESDVDGVVEAGESTLTVDEAELERQYYGGDEAAVWSNAQSVSFSGVEVVTAGAEDPAADSYTRTITYELERETYLGASEEFDAFFAAATPEGGELTPAGDAGTTWVITFPAGSAADVASWTDAALGTTGSTFTVESGPSEDDPFAIETRVVDDIPCTAACGVGEEGESTGILHQHLQLPAGAAEGEVSEDGTTVRVSLAGGPEPEVITRHIVFTEAAYDLTVNREGGGSATVTLALPTADDAVVTEENVVALLGEGTERSEADDLVTYTRTVEADTSAEFPGALQTLGLEGEDGAPLVTVTDQGEGTYYAELVMGPNATIAPTLGVSPAWSVQGDGLAVTQIVEDGTETATLGDEGVTAAESPYLAIAVTAERTGLGTGAIVGIVVGVAVLGLLVAAGVLAYLHRARIAALLRPDTTA